MRLVIVAQEEPVWMGPCLIEVMRARKNDIVAVAVAPRRGVAGKETPEQRRALIQMLGWPTALRALFIRNAFGNARSIARAARQLGLRVIPFSNIKDAGFRTELRGLAPDVIVNQSEFILDADFLSIPRLGVVNRHGARLPQFRGRVASFWAHAAGEAEIGITIHFVDEGIDTGPIIYQESFPSDPRWSYGRVMDEMWRHSPGVLLRGLEKLEQPGFAAQPNRWREDGSPARKFPTLAEVRDYRARLYTRRKS